MNQSFRRIKEKTDKRYDSSLMSERWEEFIKIWYATNHISNLEYLDLTKKSNPSNQELAHNILVIYNKLCLSSKVHLKNFKLIIEKLQKQENEIFKLEVEIKILSEKKHIPKDRAESRNNIILEEINQKLKGIEEAIKELKRSVSG